MRQFRRKSRDSEAVPNSRGMERDPFIVPKVGICRLRGREHPGMTGRHD